MIPVYLEPMLDEALEKVIPKEHSKSGYIRNLIIEDLKARSLLTDSMIVQFLC